MFILDKHTISLCFHQKSFLRSRQNNVVAKAQAMKLAWVESNSNSSTSVLCGPGQVS